MNKEIIVDGSGLIVGRLAAFCAKRALSGYSVEVANIEKTVISGSRDMVVAVYKKRRTMTNYANPEQAAKWPRRPDFLFKRIVQGMLPASRRGKEAAKRIKAHLGQQSKTASKLKLIRDSSKLKRGFVSLGEVCQALGWAVHG